MNPYVVFMLYLATILGFVAVTLWMNHALGPKPVASMVKLEPFECGATPMSTRNVKAVPIKGHRSGHRVLNQLVEQKIQAFE
jgi:NADH-quinone oxidoreductase subunit A